MTGVRAFVCGAGIVSAAGLGVEQTWEAIRRGTSAIAPLSLFPAAQTPPLPVGEVRDAFDAGGLPRTHALALAAVREAMAGTALIPDAVVLGGTTGGMPVTEILMQKGDARPEAYRSHALATVAAGVARRLSCRGPVLTVSTACSSGTAALKVALELIRCGQARVVLAGGADALCRMTYYGFHALQLIDPDGARPLDLERRGLSVAEGAAFVLLLAAGEPPPGALAELSGAGLSCDAHHPAAPHPEGAGARAAMQAALADAGLAPPDIDYLNLHGTGTVDNDAAEARAVRDLFGAAPPPLSSVKGLFGHSLGASGAIEAVVSALAIDRGFIPANVGCRIPDPALGLRPETAGRTAAVGAVLSNSFGFGGNNAALVLTAPRRRASPATVRPPARFSVLGAACLTGAGDIEATFARFSRGEPWGGRPDLGTVRTDIPAGVVRRLKRLPRLTLLLAEAARRAAGAGTPCGGIFFGTAWGALSETHDFLDKLFASGERFTSPTDFVGSVHNAPASQAAIVVRAPGPNLTVSGGDHSFEQALFTAGLIQRAGDAAALVVGAEEWHAALSPRLDPAATAELDGGAAFLLAADPGRPGVGLAPVFQAFCPDSDDGLSALIDRLGGPVGVQRCFGAVFAGWPPSEQARGEALLEGFLRRTAFAGPVVRYRRFTGEFAGASAVATALAVETVRRGELPGPLAAGRPVALAGRGLLVIGLGDTVSGIEVTAG